MIDPTDVRKLVDYNPKTGELFWRKRDISLFSNGKVSPNRAMRTWNTKHAGKQITAKTGDGYIEVCISVGGRQAHAGHRLAWCHYYGAWPNGVIDHMNGKKSDNRIDNLRDCTPSENGRNRNPGTNNKSGRLGVYFCKLKQRWRANMKIHGKVHHLGYFRSIEDAEAARAVAEEKNGFFNPNDAPAIRRKIEAAKADVEKAKNKHGPNRES